MADQDKLIAILKYLEDWDKLTRSPVSSVLEYRAGLVAFQKEVVEITPIRLNIVEGDGEAVWMQVPRLSKTRPPNPPQDLSRWVSLKDDPEVRPEHLDSIDLPPEDGETEGQTVLFDERLAKLFDEYVGGVWFDWAEREKVNRRCIALYEKLFHLQQTIENAGTETPVEIVWGMGMAVWDSAGHRINHPLITQQMEILPPGRDMSLRLRPTSRDPQIETDPFLPLELAELPAFERSARSFFIDAASTPSPFEPASFETIAIKAASQLDTSGRYWPEETDYVAGGLPEPSSNLKVTDSWVLFSRKRTTTFLIDDLKRLQAAIEEEGVPDGAPSHLVEEPVGFLPEPPEIQFRGLSTAGASAGIGESQELFFPKPFNEEQVEIIRRLETEAGVVVQGPPGTGKTHTIANVICHFLAQGKRVLVTSKGETALAVLQEQIPEQIRQLTVSMLTNERQGKEQLEKTVKNINAKLTTLRSSQLKAEIATRDNEIEGLHQKISSIDSMLRAWARKNTEPAPNSIGGLSPEALARDVCASEDKYSWFPDQLDDRVEHEPAFEEVDVRALAASRAELGTDLQYVETQLPDSSDFLAPAELASIHESLREERELASLRDSSDLPRFPLDDEETLAVATRLHTEVSDHLSLIAACEVPWLSTLREKFRQRAQNGEHAVLLETLDGLKVEALSLGEGFSKFVATAIEILPEAQEDKGVRDAIRKAAEGRRPFSLVSLGSRAAKQRFEEIRMNGRKPRGAEEWKQLDHFCRLRDEGHDLLHRWNKFSVGVEGPTVDLTGEAAARQLAELALNVDKAMTLACNYDLTLSDRVKQLFPSICVDTVRAEESFLIKLEKSLRIQVRRAQLASAKETASSLQRFIRPLKGSLFSKMSEWIERSLGGSSVTGDQAENTWRSFLEELNRLRDRESAFKTVREVTSQIHQCGAELWSQRLRSEPVLKGSDPLIPSDWREAWQWSRQRGFLQAIDGRAHILKVSAERRDAENRLRRSYESTIENRTWLKLVENLRMDKAIGRAITAYVQAIRSMTKSGTGKRDVKLRHAAREAMHHASRGVPCWIMPHWRVSEALPPRLADFDLVIVDEASQSDAWAVPSIIRGKKILIVGDDKQVGPQPSFTRQEQIDQIQERLKVAGLPSDIRNRLDPKESIYDLGELVFAGQTIRLREHFRCAEPIIEFSNKLCYDNEIKCVRVPDATERLLPTLIDVHVASGRRDSTRKVNKPEADAIVEEIAMLVAHEDFGKRSIGVVSLLGPDQGKLIFDTILEKIGEEAFLKHRIRCGDARTFQGSEADVIFISAVDDSASGAVMGSGRLDNVRRINVAVSRARDRLYFYHSFARADLSELDLRARLMDHIKAPLAGLSPARGRDLCESNFEREMFDAITERGYRVLPQVGVGNYRIDLVVEGQGRKRLAIECDGDQYHGPDKWMQDLGRQRVLERAGWKFWRCWGSSFARDRKECLADLVARLNSEGITPTGAESLDFGELVEFRVVGALDEEDFIPVETKRRG